MFKNTLNPTIFILMAFSLFRPLDSSPIQPLLELQHKAIEESNYPKDQLSLVFSRIDTEVVNGLAYNRIVQIYHNPTEEKRAVSFRLPLLPDTIISGFNIWDRGKRYPGSIGLRQEAEKAYRKVSGDETPELKEERLDADTVNRENRLNNRDPGLVRKNNSLYEVRVAPIFPGEFKQVELFFHRRLVMEKGRFVMKLPLADLTMVVCDQGKKLAACLSWVKVKIEDELPIKNTEGLSGFEKSSSSPYLSTYTLQQKHQLDDITISFLPELGENNHVSALSYKDDGTQHNLLRLVCRIPEVQNDQLANTTKPFYWGYWSGNKTLGAPPSQAEALAISSLMACDGRFPFRGTYMARPPEKKGKFNIIRTPRLISKNEIFSVLKEEKLDQKSTQSPESLALVHLLGAVEKDQCRTIYLFLMDIDESFTRLLADFAADHRQSLFILYLGGKTPTPLLMGHNNVKLFHESEGWLNHKPENSRIFYPMNFSSLITDSSSWRSQILPFWSVWKHLVPMGLSAGPQPLHKINLYTDRDNRSSPYQAGQLEVFWVDANSRGAGKGSITLYLKNRNRSEFVDAYLNGEQPPFYRVHAKYELPNPEKEGHQVAGVYQAIRQANLLATKLTPKNPRNTRRRTPIAPEEAEDIRHSILNLSHQWKFLHNETAFIALPDSDRKAFGFLPLNEEQNKHFNMQGMKNGGVPEPEEI
ncbi:MAG: hypothetical protein HQL32_12285, partial [Planctomycetes bacterium]|nr:hypothetical protein [Planctomycetota bacterium]